MAKDNFKDKAAKILADHPEENKVIIVENGQCFFNDKAAQDYHDKSGFETEPKVFFREGFEPEDDSDLAEAYEQVQQENEDLKKLVEQINEALDPDVAITVDKDTPEEVANIVQLREALDAETETNKNLQENLAALKEAIKDNQETDNKQENAKTKTNSKKA